MRVAGYEVYLYYYWLSSPDLAIQRIASRVKSCGHFVPDATMRQRSSRSVRNFFDLYREHADYWEVYDNSYGQRELIAIGSIDDESIGDEAIWDAFKRSANDA